MAIMVCVCIMTNSFWLECEDCYLGLRKVPKKEAIEIAKEHLVNTKHSKVTIKPEFLPKTKLGSIVITLTEALSAT